MGDSTQERLDNARELIESLRAELAEAKAKKRELLELSILLATADENGEEEERRQIAKRFVDAYPAAIARAEAAERALTKPTDESSKGGSTDG